MSHRHQQCENPPCVLCLVAQLCSTLSIPSNIARQAPLSMGISRQECYSGLPGPPPGDFPNPGIKPRTHIVGRFFTIWATRETQEYWSAPPHLPHFCWWKKCGFGMREVLTLRLPLKDPPLERQCICSAPPAREGRLGIREYPYPFSRGREIRNQGISLSLLQGIFPTQELNWGLLCCRWILYQLSYPGSQRPTPSQSLIYFILVFEMLD